MPNYVFRDGRRQKLRFRNSLTTVINCAKLVPNVIALGIVANEKWANINDKTKTLAYLPISSPTQPNMFDEVLYCVNEKK